MKKRMELSVPDSDLRQHEDRSERVRYSGYHPYSLQKIDTAKSEKEKKQQNMFFFWYKREFREQIMTLLRRIHRADLIPKLYGKEREK